MLGRATAGGSELIDIPDEPTPFLDLSVELSRMVAKVLGLNTLPQPADAADALSLAICHALRPQGALQGGEREQHLTAAQRQWAQAAQKAARRAGVRSGM